MTTICWILICVCAGFVAADDGVLASMPISRFLSSGEVSAWKSRKARTIDLLPEQIEVFLEWTLHRFYPLYTVISLWADRDITHQCCVCHRVISNFESNWSSVLGVLWCHNLLLTDMSQCENAVMHTCYAHVISTVINYSANMHNLDAVYWSVLCTASYHNTAVKLSNVSG